MTTRCLAETYIKGECVLSDAKSDVLNYVEAVTALYRHERLAQRNRIVLVVNHTRESVRRCA